jgi:hypothetical protein
MVLQSAYESRVIREPVRGRRRRIGVDLELEQEVLVHEHGRERVAKADRSRRSEHLRLTEGSEQRVDFRGRHRAAERATHEPAERRTRTRLALRFHVARHESRAPRGIAERVVDELVRRIFVVACRSRRQAQRGADGVVTGARRVGLERVRGAQRRAE